jgi:hypothetical protein
LKKNEPIVLDKDKEKFAAALNKWIVPALLKLDPAELERRKEQREKEDTA